MTKKPTKSKIANARRTFSREFKDQIVLEAQMWTCPRKELAEKHGITPSSIYKWRADVMTELKTGAVARATILESTKEPDPDDLEYTIYRIKWEFYYERVRCADNACICLNTMHIEYAFRGMLWGSPRINFTVADIEAAMAVGKTIDVQFLPRNPAINKTLASMLLQRASRIH